MPSDHADRVIAPFGRLSLTTKGILVVALPVCALLAAMVVFYLFQRQTRDAAAWVEHTYQVRGEIRRLVARLATADAALHSYLLTGRVSFLDPYWNARREIPDPLDALGRLVSQDPEKAMRAARVRTLVAKALDSMDELRRAASSQPPPNAGDLERGKADTDAARRELAEMGAEEDRLLVARTEQERRAERRLQIGIFAGGLLGLLGGVVAALLFTTRIVRRVQHLEDDARRVAQGLPILEEVRGRTKSRGWGVLSKSPPGWSWRNTKNCGRPTRNWNLVSSSVPSN